MKENGINNSWCLYILLTEKTHQIFALIYRFFTIILLVATITWIPILETAHSEKLFEHMQIVRSFLAPPITALFLLAVFCKRVNEQVGVAWNSMSDCLHNGDLLCLEGSLQDIICFLRDDGLLGNFGSSLLLCIGRTRRFLICFPPFLM